MVFEKLTNKKIDEMCDWLEFYDKHGYLPFEKKKITITVSGFASEKLKKIKNKSKFINNLIIKKAQKTIY